MNRNIQPGLQGEQKDELKSSEDHFEVFWKEQTRPSLNASTRRVEKR